jgi:hypothetical protein
MAYPLPLLRRVDPFCRLVFLNCIAAFERPWFYNHLSFFWTLLGVLTNC